MTLIGVRSKNHPQQVAKRGVDRNGDDRATEPGFFSDLHARFSFTIDVAAAAHNAKLPRFWTLADDGLRQSWAGERVWCNPPYSAIWPWIRKAWWETNCPLVVMLLPANRTEQRWWQREVEPHRDRGGVLSVEFLPGRLRFIAAGAEGIGPNERPPFGCCLLIWNRP